MRSTLSLALALSLALGACSSDGDDRPVDPSQVRLQIVSGDRQTAQVAGSGASQSVATVAASLQQGPITEDLLFPERLVVRAVGTGASTSSAPMGPSLNAGASGVPGVSVTWSTRPEGCGKPVEVSKVTDDNGEAVNRWIRGTKAGECFMDVCRVLASGEVVCDATYTATQLPGPVVDVVWSGEGFPVSVSAGDTIDVSTGIAYGLDQHYNRITRETLVATESAKVAWSRAAMGGQVCSGWHEPTLEQEGWKIEVPAEVAEWPMNGIDLNACLHVWVSGKPAAITEMTVR